MRLQALPWLEDRTPEVPSSAAKNRAIMAAAMRSAEEPGAMRSGYVALGLTLLFVYARMADELEFGSVACPRFLYLSFSICREY